MPAASEETLDRMERLDLQILQPREGYRFSLDPLLLCDFTQTAASSVLDLGCGCGIIPLVMARRLTAARIVAVELQPSMAALAVRNVALNSLSDRISIVNADILVLHGLLPSDSFDLVMANPPYRKAGSGRTSPRAGRDLARHESSATLDDFLTVAKRFVRPGGSICFIYHPERLAELLAAALALKLAPLRLQMVHGDAGLPARMFMVQLAKGRKCRLEVLPPLMVKDSAYGERQQYGMKRD